MHLRAVKLRGFKSFPDPVEIRLEPGVGVIVGPNGSGKSNVSDAIRWAAGSLSPTELRAEKPDDVLFAGGGSRGPSDFCEVELLFDNADGALPVDYAELSVARRLHRGGEGQYLVNRAAVRRLDLVELLADLGLGQGMHSIISQGKVEAILASKPAERRALIEEAAGLGRFKARRHRAELKLARVALEVERARDVEAEVRKRLRPLALQATAAERAQKLASRDRAPACAHRAARPRGDRAAARRARDPAQLRLRRGGKPWRRGSRRCSPSAARAEEELADAAGAREQALQALYRLRSAAERLELRRESVEARVLRLRDALAPPASRPRRVAFVPSGRRWPSEIRLLEGRLLALDRTLAEREGLPPAARALAEEGERIAFSLLEVEPGRERAVTAALGRSRLRRRPGRCDRRARAARAGARRGSRQPRRPRRPRSGAARRRDCLSSRRRSCWRRRSRAVTPEGFGYDPERGELWFAGETAEAMLLELQARRRTLAGELDELRARLDTPIPDAAYSLERESDRRSAASSSPSGSCTRSTSRSAHLETPLRAGVDTGAARSGELGAELRRLGAAEVELRQELDRRRPRPASAVEIEAARLEAEADEARRRLEQANADEPAEGDDREQLVATVERLERRRETLGQVNPLAHEEYEAEKVRLEELATQRADLEASLDELEKLRNELTETVERRFTETFDAVQRPLRRRDGDALPGRRGPPPADRGREEDEDGREPGVEVELRPAGKRVQRLSLLSGGEKALGAIAFLFALFLARPCPFYLLDEVEAALDDTNIGRFVELLRRYSDRAQFVVITHQKRTMEAADVLYGVTMGGEGVSQVVSRRLPREEAEAASAAVGSRSCCTTRRVRAADRRAVGRGARPRRRSRRSSRTPTPRSIPTALAGARVGRLAGGAADEEPLRRRGGRGLRARRAAAPRSRRDDARPARRGDCVRSSAGARSRTTWRARSSPSRPPPALLTGEAGILLVACRLGRRRSTTTCARSSARTSANEAEDLCGGRRDAASPRPRWAGTTWRARVADALASRRDADGLWTQRLWGTSFRGVGTVHGLAGNVRALAPGRRRAQRGASRRVRRALSRAPRREEDGLANWSSEGKLQWCVGAPGIVSAARDYLDEELLLAGAELVWRAGPPGDGEGTRHLPRHSGNGFALLAAFERTQDELWLDRARRFAVHALAQAARLPARYSLFTGGAGTALFAAACLEADARYPVLERR